MKLNELEFGRELEFFTANHATRSAKEVLDGQPTDRCEVTVSGQRLVLWIDSKTEKPVRISLVKGMETQTIEYLSYDELPFDPLLFQPPVGIALVDAR